jgi:hypothetical protein
VNLQRYVFPIEDPTETGDIAVELEKLACCPQVFSKRTVDACKQAASLLTRMRPILLSREPDAEVVEILKIILSRQGDG